MEITQELLMEKENEYGYKIIEMEVMREHVHLLIDLKTGNRCDNICINLIKGYTSHILRNDYIELRRKISTLWIR